MRVAFYSQHVLGMGHLFRSLEIVKALCGHEVAFITGGAEADLPVPEGVRRVQLPGIMMDAAFSTFIPVEEGASLEEVFERRTRQLLEFLISFQPDVFLVELFPFGRNKFGLELLPALEAARNGRFGACRTACSVRDILVEKSNQAKYEGRVLRNLNPNFDLLLIHADPDFIRLEETFPAFGDITVPSVHTGYVTPMPDASAVAQIRAELSPDDLPLIIASAGSGSVGGELLEAAVAGSALLAESVPHRLKVFTGPYMDADVVARMNTVAEKSAHIIVEKFTKRFTEHLAAADLSVSMGGYNTTMNLLAAQTFGLMFSFDQNREQRMRAERLQERGALALIEAADLEPQRMARLMAQALGQSAGPHGIDLEGAAKSAQALCDLHAGRITRE